MQKTILENVSVFNKATVEEKVREVMNIKDRKTYFIFSGGSNLEFDDTEREYYLDYTEDEISRIKNLFIEAYNDGLSEDERVSTIEEVEKLIGLDELKGYHEDLDKLIDRCWDLDFYLQHIDFQPRHLYTMSMLFWSPYTEQMSDRIPFRVELSDEEYEYLLARQFSSELFTFNRLIGEKPELAYKISDAADGRIGGGISNNGHPMLIIFDEVLADVESVNGPYSRTLQLFEDYSGEHSIHVAAYTEGRTLIVFREDWVDGEPAAPDQRLSEISADEVMKRLDAKNYYYMLKKLRENFNTSSALDNIKGWLQQEGLSFVETNE
jgi:hypothetical protein